MTKNTNNISLLEGRVTKLENVSWNEYDLNCTSTNALYTESGSHNLTFEGKIYTSYLGIYARIKVFATDNITILANESIGGGGVINLITPLPNILEDQYISQNINSLSTASSCYSNGVSFTNNSLGMLFKLGAIYHYSSSTQNSLILPFEYVGFVNAMTRTSNNCDFKITFFQPFIKI